MTEGTRSLIFGCHQFFLHPFFILIAWVKLYGKLPKFWQLVCIFVHDWGLWGMNYLSKSKSGHWIYGAFTAYNLFGREGFDFCAGHTDESRQLGFTTRSLLFFADKDSRFFTPFWIGCVHNKIEGFDKMGFLGIAGHRRLQALARENKRLGYPRDNHTIFLEERR